MKNNDQNKSVERISNEVKSSLMYTGAVQTVSAFSVGSLIAAHMLDVTGIPLALLPRLTLLNPCLVSPP
jgi:hypothetical protein